MRGAVKQLLPQKTGQSRRELSSFQSTFPFVLYDTVGRSIGALLSRLRHTDMQLDCKDTVVIILTRLSLLTAR